MPTPLVTQHYPHDFQIFTHVVHDASAADLVWLYADRIMVIDSIVVTAMHTSAVGGSATVQLVKVAKDTIPTSTNIQAGTAISNAISVAANTAVTEGTITTSTNEVAAGSWVCLKWTAGGGTLANFRGAIQMRFRSQQA